MFDLDTFLADCIEARAEAEPHRALKDVLDRTVSEPGQVRDALATTVAGVHRLHVSDDLTVLNVVWAPGMQLRPHDHRMWAAIAVYGGIEDNAFFRRADGTITPSGGKRIEEGDAIQLGVDTIHGVTNPLDRHTGAIHVYDGDFFTQARSEWDPETLQESPFDVGRLITFFEEANRT
jgi:predicted metal-dependent enzyme (double-stranded beta helix superfamily)